MMKKLLSPTERDSLTKDMNDASALDDDDFDDIPPPESAPDII